MTKAIQRILWTMQDALGPGLSSELKKEEILTNGRILNTIFQEGEEMLTPEL